MEGVSFKIRIMEDRFQFTTNEREESVRKWKKLRKSIGSTLKTGDEEAVYKHIGSAMRNNQIQRDVFGLNPILHSLQTAEVAVDEIGLKRDGVLAILLYENVVNDFAGEAEITDKFGVSVAQIIHGLVKIHGLYKKNPIIESENFRNLLI